MMDISPTTTISHALIGYVIVHCQELLLHFFPNHRFRRTIIICNSYSFHQIEISTHFHTHLSEHILVPIRNDSFISFGGTYHIDRYSRNLTVFVSDLIEIIFLANIFNLFICDLAFRVDHITKTLFQQLHFCSLLIVYRSQFNIRFQKRVLIDNQPMVGGSGIDKRDLQIGRLLTCINLSSRNQMIDEKGSF